MTRQHLVPRGKDLVSVARDTCGIHAQVAGRVSPKARDRLRSGFAFFGGAELCQGPPPGNRITLARSDQWVKRSKKVAPKKALLEVCKRFVGTYGPVAPSAFSEWFSTGLTPDAARSLFASLELEEVSVEGHPAFVLAGGTRFPRATAELRLLSEYDVYVMGFRERDHLVPLRVREQVSSHTKGRYEGPAGVRFLTVGGMAVGLWERAKRGQRIEISVDPSRRLTRAERAELGHEADRIGSFLGLEPVLTVA